MRKPIKLLAVETAFGGRAMDILPPMSEIPEEFHKGNKWTRLAAQWFFGGLHTMPPVKEGFDAADVQANLQTALRSFEPKHEHKEAGVGYLMSLWLEDGDDDRLSSFSAKSSK